MDLLRTHTPPLPRSGVIWSLWALCAILWSVVFAAPAVAAPPGQECVDIEALGNLTLSEDGRRRAAELVRQGDPARDFLCVELGWDCDNDPTFQVLSLDIRRDGDDLDTTQPDCAGSLGADESRCEDPSSGAAWASVIDILLDEPARPLAPNLHYGPACYDSPTLCGAPPPARPFTPPTANPVPVLAEVDLHFAPTSRQGHRAPPAVRNQTEGTGPAAGAARDIDRPPIA